MHQWSSKSIARLAAALAKAQAELVNPKKSLTATIYPEGADGASRTFNYASLADGLEIVRKTLSQHAIAVLQTTAIEEAARIVKLTTVLAHSSGEWVAADWPVCGVEATAEPHRMGAALSYARRHALFALTGIAGEDDLDAPDLQTPSGDAHGTPQGKGATTGRTIGNGRLSSSRARMATTPVHSRKRILAAAQSAALRDRLLCEVSTIGSADDAAFWAYCNLRAKDGLSTEDAQCVERAFEAKVSALTMPAASPPGRRPAAQSTRFPPKRRLRRSKKRPLAGIDKSMLAFPEPRRVRDREHVRFVAKQPCLVCGRMPSDPHHLRFAQSRALGRKVSDEFTVPLCRGHHREVHRCGDEAAWWRQTGVDSTTAARALWLRTHPVPTNQAQLPLNAGSHRRPTEAG